MTVPKFDVFISHAAEDKTDVAIPLARALNEQGFRVWLDEFELRLGDNLRRSIENGVRLSRFGVVVLSPDFLKNGWPQRELDALLAREVQGEGSVILPVWHNISAQDVARFSPMLADRLAISTERGIGSVAKAIAEAVLIKVQGDSDGAAARLEMIIERLDRLERERFTNSPAQPDGPRLNEDENQVFVISGGDAGAQESVCGFLEKIGIRPIVPSVQPWLKTVQEIDEYPQATFAVVLLGSVHSAFGSTGGTSGLAVDPFSWLRSGFVFELGYLVGKLGWNHVCLLDPLMRDLSALEGIIGINMDPAHGWRISLAKELRQAGIRIDLNKVLE